MIKATLYACVLALTVSLTACGGDSAPAVKASPEMTAFMGMFNGRLEGVEAALKAYESEGLDKKDMDMYSMKDPKVVAADKDCYTMEAAAGVTTRTYVICWEGGKIKSIEDKGIK